MLETHLFGVNSPKAESQIRQHRADESGPVERELGRTRRCDAERDWQERERDWHRRGRAEHKLTHGDVENRLERLHRMRE